MFVWKFLGGVVEGGDHNNVLFEKQYFIKCNFNSRDREPHGEEFFSGDAVIIYWFAYNFPQATFQTI